LIAKISDSLTTDNINNRLKRKHEAQQINGDLMRISWELRETSPRASILTFTRLEAFQEGSNMNLTNIPTLPVYFIFDIAIFDSLNLQIQLLRLPCSCGLVQSTMMMLMNWVVAKSPLTSIFPST